MQVKKIPFTSYDLASDENAKRLWKRKAPPGEMFESTSLEPWVQPELHVFVHRLERLTRFPQTSSNYPEY